jgi:hypothetical protein
VAQVRTSGIEAERQALELADRVKVDSSTVERVRETRRAERQATVDRASRVAGKDRGDAEHS